MNASTTGEWTVTDAERAEFARFSGDHNPIHDDPVAARRLHGGRLLVHGAHLLLGVIDQAIVAGHLATTPRSVTVTFLHGVEPGMPLTTSFELDDGAVRAQVTADIWPAVDIVIHPGNARPASFVDAPPLEGADEQPQKHGFPELAGLSGSVALAAVVDHATAFAHATDVLGDVRVTEIAAISRVVGMRTPGLYSMSAKYEIEFSQAADGTEPTELEYRVEAADSRMRRVRLGLSGPTMTATVTAFSPPPPVDQRQVLAGGEQPVPNEFAGWRALVVGGSRGLGAAAVRLLVAGGADVRFTYLDGVADAEIVVTDTDAGAFRFAADSDDRLGDHLDGWQPTHLCWFASPPRSGGVAGLFSQRLHEQLSTVMVNAFERHVADTSTPPLRAVLWPSSELVDRPGRGNDELVAVLVAGEASCHRLAASRPGLAVHVPRWPRLATDQTASLLPVEYADTASIMLSALRALPN